MMDDGLRLILLHFRISIELSVHLNELLYLHVLILINRTINDLFLLHLVFNVYFYLFCFYLITEPTIFRVVNAAVDDFVLILRRVYNVSGLVESVT